MLNPGVECIRPGTRRGCSGARLWPAMEHARCGGNGLSLHCRWKAIARRERVSRCGGACLPSPRGAPVFRYGRIPTRDRRGCLERRVNRPEEPARETCSVASVSRLSRLIRRASPLRGCARWLPAISWVIVKRAWWLPWALSDRPKMPLWDARSRFRVSRTARVTLGLCNEARIATGLGSVHGGRGSQSMCSIKHRCSRWAVHPQAPDRRNGWWVRWSYWSCERVPGSV